MKNKKILILFIIILLVIIGIFLLTIFNKKNNTENTNNKNETVKGNVLYIEDWDFYKNDSLGLAVQHPKNMSAIEYLDNAKQKVVNFKYDDKQSSSYSITIIDNKDKTFTDDTYRIIYSNPNDFNITKKQVNIDDVIGTRYIVDDNASGDNRADDVIFEKNGKTYIISAAIKDANFENFYRTFDFLSE